MYVIEGSAGMRREQTQGELRTCHNSTILDTGVDEQDAVNK